MQAVVYTRNGDPDVLELVDREVPEPGPGEVRVRVAASGVNPTDWKSRRNNPIPAGFQIPDQDGSGVVDAVGNGVDPAVLGERVWLWEAAYQRPWGTAAEYTVVPQRQAVLLPANASLELGACLGVPFLTAHRCLTLGESMPDRLDQGALTGRTVLVQGGAGAVGNAAIQLARWADAHGHHDREQPGEGPARGRGRGGRHRQLPDPGRAGRGAQDRPARGGRDRRGLGGPQRRDRRAGHRHARRGRDLRRRRRRRA